MVSLYGNPMITGDKFVINKLRCNLCSKIFTPNKYTKELQSKPKYNASCSVALAVNKYQLGSTFTRIAKIQAMAGIPLPASTQWDLINELSYRVEPVVAILEYLAAQSNKLYFDDSPHKILTSKCPAKTTAVIANYSTYKIKLFYTGLHTASKNINGLLTKRKSTESLLTMSDAANSNFSASMPVNVFSNLIICFCLVHGRRYFHKLLDFFEVECSFVLDCISKVYAAEHYCRNNKLSNDERLQYHRQHSKPIMTNLRIWLINQFKFNSKIELNNPLGQAIAYMLKNWHAITKFLNYAGAAIDNNICERLIKTSIVHRKNSLFYKTPRGAKVGAIMMSLIQTCCANNINPYDYLIYLHNNYGSIASQPAQFLPWNYRKKIVQVKNVA